MNHITTGSSLRQLIRLRETAGPTIEKPRMFHGQNAKSRSQCLVFKREIPLPRGRRNNRETCSTPSGKVRQLIGLRVRQREMQPVFRSGANEVDSPPPHDGLQIPSLRQKMDSQSAHGRSGPYCPHEQSCAGPSQPGNHPRAISQQPCLRTRQDTPQTGGNLRTWP